MVSKPSPNEELVITGLTDSVYGDLATRPGSTCGALIGQRIAPGGAPHTCTFTADITGGPGTHTNVVTATGTGDEGSPPVTDTDDATVTIVNVPPTIAVTKTPNPVSRQAPGGPFTYPVRITNTSGPTDPVPILSITDNPYAAEIAASPSCQAIITETATTPIPPGGFRECTFTANFMGNAGDSRTDTVTVTGEDDEGTDAPPATAQAAVFLTGAPVIEVIKDVTPESLPEPGGDFTYTIRVRNLSSTPVTITSLVDDVYGDLATRPGSTCGQLIGDVLAANGGTSDPCTFTAPFTGAPGDTETDTVTATAVDPSGNPATDTDPATVRIIPAPSVPSIQVIKDASPGSRPEPGGTFTFTVTVRNTSPSNNVRSPVSPTTSTATSPPVRARPAGRSSAGSSLPTRPPRAR